MKLKQASRTHHTSAKGLFLLIAKFVNLQNFWKPNCDRHNESTKDSKENTKKLGAPVEWRWSRHRLRIPSDCAACWSCQTWCWRSPLSLPPGRSCTPALAGLWREPVSQRSQLYYQIQYWEIHIAAKEMPGESKVKVKDRGDKELINFKIYSWVTLDVTHTLLYIAHVKILSCCYLMLLFELWRSWMVVGRDNSADDDAV